jgi:hypothetical protein
MSDAMETRHVTFDAFEAIGDERVPHKVTVNARGHVVMPRVSTDRELNFRQAIACAEGLEQQVLIDVYRALVLADFVKFNGERGQTARPDLDREYPRQGILPDLDYETYRSQKTNHSGQLLYYVLSHPGEQVWEIVAGILASGLTSRVFCAPRIEPIGGERIPWPPASAS